MILYCIPVLVSLLLFTKINDLYQGVQYHVYQCTDTMYMHDSVLLINVSG